MKKLIIQALSLASLVGLAACEAEYPEVNIKPDPIFENSGMQVLSTISIYDKVDMQVGITRTAGVSKQVALALVVDEALLEEYNELYGTSYELLAEQYYDIPESVDFASLTKQTGFSLTLRPHALVEAEGLAAANNKVLPVRIADTSIPTENLGSQMTLLLHPEIVVPRVEVEVPRENAVLQFISSVHLPQSIVINAEANFTTLDVAALSYAPVESEVAVYNQTHGTACKYLDPRFYTIAGSEFDAETRMLASTVSFNGYELESAEGYEEGDVFLLPLRLKSDSYDIVQYNTLFVAVELSELRVWLANGGRSVVSSTGRGSVAVQMNSPINEPQPIDLKYDPSKVAAFNSANGTSYDALPSSIVPVTLESLIPVGGQSGEVAYDIDIADMDYDIGTFVAPLSIERSIMLYEPVVDESRETVYILVRKTLKGNYEKEIWGEEKSNRILAPTIYVAGEDNFLPSKNTDANQKYIINYNQTWAGGLIYFNVSDQTVPGYPSRRILTDFCDRPNEWWSGYDEIVDSGSWFDTETETFYFNLRVMDMAYASQGGFGIECYLRNRTDL
ncbi:MAG: DUF1735 domain-containing protein [Alistipes sp.]|nr:DUF1735 domain-containing protein [Alistipes sp.]MDE6777940.1 DUF1735 domain-containing protein [Alistipes sp.]